MSVVGFVMLTPRTGRSNRFGYNADSKSDHPRARTSRQLLPTSTSSIGHDDEAASPCSTRTPSQTAAIASNGQTYDEAVYPPRSPGPIQGRR